MQHFENPLTTVELHLYLIMRNARKRPNCNLRTTQVQMNLRECRGCLGPSLPAYRIKVYCCICRRAENAQIRLHGCTCWSWPSQFAYDIRALFPHIRHTEWGNMGLRITKLRVNVMVHICDKVSFLKVQCTTIKQCMISCKCTGSCVTNLIVSLRGHGVRVLITFHQFPLQH